MGSIFKQQIQHLLAQESEFGYTAKAETVKNMQALFTQLITREEDLNVLTIPVFLNQINSALIQNR